MSSEGELDLTSEALPSTNNLPHAARPHSHGDAGPASRKPAKQSMQAYFYCCKVVAMVTVPQGVSDGRLSSWRFHCPRCGKLVEIPLD